MNYIKIEKYSTVNGFGLRNVLWISGCHFHCNGCHNQESWDFNAGQLYTKEVYNELVNEFRNSIFKNTLDGITLLGGEPLALENRDISLEICKKFKEEFPDKTIWCWTGYNYEQICDLKILKYVDVLVDGRFEIDKLNLTLKYRGSTNQRVIRLNKAAKI